MDEFINQLLGALLAGFVLTSGFCLFLFDQLNREVGAAAAAHWLYRALS